MIQTLNEGPASDNNGHTFMQISVSRYTRNQLNENRTTDFKLSNLLLGEEET